MKAIALFGSICLLSLLAGCAQLPTDFPNEEMTTITNTEQTLLAKKSKHLREIVDQQKNKRELTDEDSVMFLMNHGTDAFYARLSLIAEAEKTIDVQYYIWESDIIGNTLLHEMIKAADRGVRVRILLDDFNLDSRMQDLAYSIDQHPNIYVKLFNPFANRDMRVGDFATDAARINRRMHNKTFSVDNQFTIVGGRNIGDEYFAADETGMFVDLDALISGPAVKQVENQFDIFWNSEPVYPISAFSDNEATTVDLVRTKKELSDYVTALSGSAYNKDLLDSAFYREFSKFHHDDYTDLTIPVYYGDVDVIYDDPQKGLGKKDNEINYLKSQLIPYVTATTHSLEIISPYFVPGDSGVQYLAELVKRGVNVRVLTNSLSSTDGVMAQSGYSRHRYDLLKAGVELYEIRTDIAEKLSYKMRQSAKASSGLHAKSYIFDRERIFIGTFNFDQRSENINTEVGLVYNDPDMASHVASYVFDETIKYYAFQVILKKDPDNPDNEQIIWLDNTDKISIEYDTEPNASVWRQWVQDFYSILPIESEL